MRLPRHGSACCAAGDSRPDPVPSTPPVPAEGHIAEAVQYRLLDLKF